MPDPDAAKLPWRHSVVPAMPSGALRRVGSLALAIGLELILLLVLLSIGIGRDAPAPESETIVSFDVSDQSASESMERADTQPEDRSAAPEAVEQPESQTSPEILPSALPPVRSLDYSLPPQPEPSPAPTPSPSSSIGVVVRSDRNYGPPDTGTPAGADSERVGTAPDGSPLYAARWFREPGPQELSGYLSTATSPGWGLIACRTAPNWRVEDCEIIGEQPANSGIARAVQAAAWQFQVRPPRIGGQYQVGSWVRIRIDYTNTRRRR